MRTATGSTASTPGFLDYAKHSGFVIKLCQPYRAKTKGKVERFNGYLRRSFYVPLASRLAQSGQKLDVVTANVEVAHWLRRGGQRARPWHDEGAAGRSTEARGSSTCKRCRRRGARTLQRPGRRPAAAPPVAPRPAAVVSRIAQPSPLQHPLRVYDALLERVAEGVAA